MITDHERNEVRSLLRRGMYSQYWFTRNFRVRCWDGSEYCTRLVAGPAYRPGIAQTEAELVRVEWPMKPGLPMYVEERRTYMTEDSDHFAENIVSYG